MSWTIGVLLVALTATVVLADPMIWSGMTLDAYHVLGNTVGLTLTNSGSTAFGGYVVVRAVVNNTPVWSVAPLSARPGQTVSAAVSFPGNVQSVTSVQVTDDLNSF
jgi:hypothetical protein